MARFGLATNYAYKSNDGCAVINTTWHNVVAWEKPEFPPLDTITLGATIYVEGRLVQQRYTDSNGQTHYAYEVLATMVEQVTDPLTMEM